MKRRDLLKFGLFGAVATMEGAGFLKIYKPICDADCMKCYNWSAVSRPFATKAAPDLSWSLAIEPMVWQHMHLSSQYSNPAPYVQKPEQRVCHIG